ncbi:hypothetical protein [Moorena sp. SIO1F2]|uniref:hypothetical protein n=1 Tax=Moorena sp. SIO1F2 TaxID=2607819 RepID=UPI00345C2F56
MRPKFLVNRYNPKVGEVLQLDFQPFYDYSPVIRDPKNIGKGVRFLNRYLSSKLFQDPEQWLESLYGFLKVLYFQGNQLLINERIHNHQQLSEQVKLALEFVSDRPDSESYDKFRFKLQEMGFEAGWGNTASRVRETLAMLDELIDEPDDRALEQFLSRIPTIFRIVLVSVHGVVPSDL